MRRLSNSWPGQACGKARHLRWNGRTSILTEKRFLCPRPTILAQKQFDAKDGEIDPNSAIVPTGGGNHIFDKKEGRRTANLLVHWPFGQFS
jgi:hypothetical protein